MNAQKHWNYISNKKRNAMLAIIALFSCPWKVSCSCWMKISSQLCQKAMAHTSCLTKRKRKLPEINRWTVAQKYLLSVPLREEGGLSLFIIITVKQDTERDEVMKWIMTRRQISNRMIKCKNLKPLLKTILHIHS